MTPSTPTPDSGAEPRGALWQRAVVGVVAAVIAAIAWLPGWLAYAVGDLLAVPWFLYWSMHDRRGKRSSGYWRNTQLAFRPGTQLDRGRPPGHLWRWSRHIAWILVDFCRMRRIHQGNLHEHCDLTEYDPVRELFEEGNGVIVASGHVGVWDVSGYVAGLLGLPVTSVFRPSPLPALNRLIERLRTGSGQTVVARKKVMWTLKRALENKEVIGLLADGGGKHSAVVAPRCVRRHIGFLSPDAATASTPSTATPTTPLTDALPLECFCESTAWGTKKCAECAGRKRDLSLASAPLAFFLEFETTGALDAVDLLRRALEHAKATCMLTQRQLAAA